MKKTYDYIHHYRGYWSEGSECRIRIYQEDGQAPVVVCSQLLDNDNTSVTNMAEYLAADIIEEHSLHSPLVWVESITLSSGRVLECVAAEDWEITCLGRAEAASV